MLIAFCTAHDAGIAVYGDHNDLECLHETVHHLCAHPNIPQSLGDFVLGFAYEVRKSFEGAREIKTFGTGRERVKYFGAKNLWPFYLVQVGLLRDFAKMQPTSSIHHAQLYLLEHITGKALAAKNPVTAEFCREWLNHFPGLTRDYITLFLEKQTHNFVFKITPKKRLDELPAILRSFHWFSDEYRPFEKKILQEAKQHGCPPENLDLEMNWPKFKW